MQEQSPCSNCAKLIPKVRLIVHETFCIKNMMKCPQCPEIIYKNELEEHIEEEHSHSNCLYCNIELKNEFLNDHVILCGSRTDTCPYCMRNITRLEMQDHVEFCEQVFIKTANKAISIQKPSELVRELEFIIKRIRKPQMSPSNDPNLDSQMLRKMTLNGSEGEK